MTDPSAFGPLPLLADGALAGGLRARAPDWRGPLEALNQERPAVVQAVHAEFAAAGARLLRTNTEHASAAALAATGLAERAEALNNSGSALARAGQREAGLAVGGQGPVDGAASPAVGFVMGALGAPPAPGAVDDPAWQRAYAEQVVYLSDTGVDFILLQHVTRLGDAVALTRRVAAVSDAPVLAALQFDPAGRTAEGADPAHAGAALVEAGAQALGLSCGPGADALPGCVEALLAMGLPVAVLPGVREPDGSAPHPAAPTLEPEAFAAWLAPLAAQGVTILGGCCGVTPAHVRALARALGK